MRSSRVFLLLSLVCLPAAACAQPSAEHAVEISADTAPPPIPREFRGVWVATVGNMDWPSRKGLPSWQQQAELVAILDKMVQLHMNAMVLQVRPAADALYNSAIEPWADELTGTMGRPPEPYYDPLSFAIEKAHERGIELHVWINPYRARDISTRALSETHVGRTNPELVRDYGSYLWLDPGDPRVRALTTRVVLDLVRRYDIDAVHMDDYFYPYPEARGGREIEFPDDATWRRYQLADGRLSRDDWRRENVNLLVKGLYESIHAEKPWVRFGISPFGIWRPGYPASVRGLDQFATLYADARKWLHEGWVDYFTPQLYWAIDRPQQSYVELLRWWTEQNTQQRNIWPGNYTGKVAFTNAQKWGADEIINQIRLTRAQPGASGNVHFSSTVFMQDPDQLDERLVSDVYATPALVPASPWLDRTSPARPVLSMRTEPLSGDRMLDLRSGSNEPAPPGVVVSTTESPSLWVVQVRGSAGWTTQILPGSQRTYLLARRAGSLPVDVRVMAVNRVGSSGPAARWDATTPAR